MYFFKNLYIFLSCILKNIYFQQHREIYCCLSGFCVLCFMKEGAVWKQSWISHKVELFHLPKMEVSHIFINSLFHFEVASGKRKSYWNMNDKNVLKEGVSKEVMESIIKLSGESSKGWKLEAFNGVSERNIGPNMRCTEMWGGKCIGKYNRHGIETE